MNDFIEEYEEMMADVRTAQMLRLAMSDYYYIVKDIMMLIEAKEVWRQFFKPMQYF